MHFPLRPRQDKVHLDKWKSGNLQPGGHSGLNDSLNFPKVIIKSEG